MLVLVFALVAVALTFVGTFVDAEPAAAHAVVTTSDPADRAKVASPPERVSITFSEPVDPGLGGISVLDRDGNRVDNDDTKQPSPEVLQATLRSGLSDGTYVMNYQLVSADGHPIRGAIVFGVGSGAIDEVAGLAAENDPLLDALSRSSQFVLYLGALLAAGLAFFLRAVHDGGSERARLSRVAGISALTAVVGIGVMIVAQTAQATGDGLGAVVSPSNLSSALGQGLGVQALVISMGLALCWASTKGSAEQRSEPATTAMAYAGAALVSVGFIIWGHANEGKVTAVALAADAAHVAAAAIWFGGLFGLITVLRARRRDQPEAPSAALAGTVGVVNRFSTSAFFSVLVLFVAGAALSFSLLDLPGDLTSTNYGKLLLAKVALVALIAFIAGYNRFSLLPWLVVDHADGEPLDPAEVRAGWRTLLNTVRFEAGAIVVVLAITAVLANTTPGAGSATTTPEPTGPFSGTESIAAGNVRLTVFPNRAGLNGLHIDLSDKDGRPADFARSVTASFTLPAKGVGPIERPMVRGGSGHFFLEDVNDLSISGEWTIDVTLRVSDFEEETVSFKDTIR